MEEIILKVDHVSKIIGKKEIVKDISFSIKSGEILGFLGPNGAGKSTTLRMIVGLSRPTTGDIRICDYSIQRQHLKAMQSVGCLIEGPDLYPYMSGYENLKMLAAMNRGITPSDIMQALERVEMTRHMHEKAGTYSLGMKQRVGIAQALMLHPKLMVLDEPTNGLDPSGINEFRMLIKKFAKEENMAVLVSSHLLLEMELMSDKVSIINNGSIVLNSTMKDLQNTKEARWRLNDLEKGRIILKNQFQIQATIFKDYLEAQVESKALSSINASFVENGLELYTIDYKQKNLEDLFLDLTKD